MRLYDDVVGCWFWYCCWCCCTAAFLFGPLLMIVGPDELPGTGSVVVVLLNWILFFGLSYAMTGWLFRLFFNFVNSTI